MLIPQVSTDWGVFYQCQLSRKQTSGSSLPIIIDAAGTAASRHSWPQPFWSGTRTHRNATQAALTHCQDTVLNIMPAFAHPRSLCRKLLSGGGSGKIPLWLDFLPCVPGTVGSGMKAWTSGYQMMSGPPGCTLHWSVSDPQVQIQSPGPVLWATHYRPSSCEAALLPWDRWEKRRPSIALPGLRSV